MPRRRPVLRIRPMVPKLQMQMSYTSGLAVGALSGAETFVSTWQCKTFHTCRCI